MKEELSCLIAACMEDVTSEEIKGLLEVPTETEFGDYSLPCFTFAKRRKKSPVKIAEELKDKLEEKGHNTDKEQKQQPIEDLITDIKAVNGYLNLFLNREYYIQKVLQETCSPNLNAGHQKRETICMDYSSPNIAKNFHIGHLRTTIIGNSLYKIFTKLGHRVIRINHLGDWGTQFGKLIVAYQNWSSKDLVKEHGIEELLRIYIRFNEEAEHNLDLQDEARAWFSKMEKGDAEALAIWKWFKEISLIEFERVYQLLGVEFDYYTGESFYMDMVPALVKELEEKHLLEESEGANIVSLDQYHMPPCLITKKDGSSIYHSRDLSAVLYRKKEFSFDQCIYVTGLEQKLHFEQVFRTIELMGYEWQDKLVHVPYGLVSLAGAKLSTRNGNILYAEDILQEAVKRALDLIEQKNPELSEKQETAKMVGIGAVIFHDLYNQRIKNVDFVWEEVLSFEGATGPYAQYTYARARSILRKAGF